MKLEELHFQGRHPALWHLKQAPELKSFLRGLRLALENFEPLTLPIFIGVALDSSECLVKVNGARVLFALQMAL